MDGSSMLSGHSPNQSLQLEKERRLNFSLVAEIY
jgi:hypothetical protein